MNLLLNVIISLITPWKVYLYCDMMETFKVVGKESGKAMSIEQSRIKDKIKDIEDFASMSNNTVSYETVADIIKDKDDSIKKDDLTEIIRELVAKGIMVEPYEEEDYTYEKTDPDKFIPADVKINQNPVNVYNLMERLENEEIDLEPGYQRKGNLWSLEAQSRLIESLMLKIPLPTFYFDASDEDKWKVIDGLQRLSAFKNFLIGVPGENGPEKMRFQGFQYLEEFNGKTFDELPRQYNRRIKEASIVAYTVEKGTPDAVVYNIFQRINTGGLPLSDQEIRQALYHGAGTDLTQTLAECQEFRTATQNAVKTERMVDREYIARFFAFTELDYKLDYKGNVDVFLIKGLKLVNTYNEDELLRIEKKFKQIMSDCTDIFGRYAFRKYGKTGKRGPINKALFELWSICFYSLSAKQMSKIKKRKAEFLERFGLLLQEPDFLLALKGGNPYSVANRIDKAKTLVKEFIC